MKIEILPTPAEVADRVAGLLAARIADNPLLCLGLATGGTMIPIYAVLAERHRAGKFSFRTATSFNLDDYVGLPADDPAGFPTYMRRHLFDHIDLPAGRHHLLDGNAANLADEAAAYERRLARTPIDLQLLGIGRNGHIGFNEPGSPFASRTRVVDLAPDTRAANARDFADSEVPARGITMGIGTILEARELLLVATGAAKSAAVTALLDGPIHEACPATALRLHANARIILSRDAAGR